MNIRDYFLKIRFATIMGGFKRARFLKKHNVLGSLGEHCMYQSRILPPEPKMVKIHNNVVIAADVRLVTHDSLSIIFRYQDKKNYIGYRGAIEIHDNVFVGSGSVILPDVCIHENSIIAAGSVVTKDVPAGTIVGGVPARIIGKYDDLKARRLAEAERYRNSGFNSIEDFWWNRFYEKRDGVSD